MPDDQIPLSDAGGSRRPKKVRRPKDWIEQGYARFDRKHPEVFEQLTKRVERLIAQGYLHYGMKAFFENFRWHKRIPYERDEQEEYKLNNNYTALYARRLLMLPQFKDFLELRARRGERTRPKKSTPRVSTSKKALPMSGNTYQRSGDRALKRPLCIDLFCGLGGWAEGFLAEGWEVIGFDIERHDYGTGGYPGQLVLQDITTLHGSQFRNADVIVASPPCQAYSYRAMPWKRAKALPPPENTLFDACFRIQREASEAAGRYIPMVVENVRGAEKWVGPAKWHFGSYYLWGDVPALMVIGGKQKLPGNNAPRMWQDRRVQRLADAQRYDGEAFYLASSGSMARKAASAQIAKIPFPLAQHIARVYKP